MAMFFIVLYRRLLAAPRSGDQVVIIDDPANRVEALISYALCVHQLIERISWLW